MKVAIMQPYIFPYIGYFQLIHAVDVFVFYDDVNFIKRGWINRNRILVNGKESLFTIAVSKASQNKLINEIKILENTKSKDHLLRTLEYNYRKAPYFEVVFNLVKEVINTSSNLISDLAINSVKLVSSYLEIDTLFEISSEKYSETKGMGKSERLITIVKREGSIDYINPSGGVELYDKLDFKKKGVNLQFIQNKLEAYSQFENESVIGLSIIDVLMFNSVEDSKRLIEKYKLI